jgi:hypothetical protein
MDEWIDRSVDYKIQARPKHARHASPEKNRIELATVVKLGAKQIGRAAFFKHTRNQINCCLLGHFDRTSKNMDD